MKASDNAEAIWTSDQDAYLYYNTLTSGSWGTEQNYNRGDPCQPGHEGILVTTGGTVYRYYRTNISYSLYENNTEVIADNGTGNHMIGASLFNDSDRYLFYVDDSDDVLLAKNDGGGWAAEATLQGDATDYDYVMTAWQYLNHNVEDELIYLFGHDSSVWYDSYDLGEPKVYITHV